jgi:putative ribosome biogenesis GTPase RsgA
MPKTATATANDTVSTIDNRNKITERKNKLVREIKQNLCINCIVFFLKHTDFSMTFYKFFNFDELKDLKLEILFNLIFYFCLTF